MSPDGELVWTAGRAGERGAQDGEGGTARFNRPNGLAVDEQGEVYVADFGNHLIRKVSPEGRVSTLAGEAGVAGAEDGVGARAHFQHPHGLAVDRNGNVYVADAMNHTVRKITPQGQVSTLAGAPGRPGIADGDRATGRLNAPYGVAVDPAGWVYVVERDGHTVRKISPEGWIMNLAGKACVSGSADGNGAEARFWSPRGIAIDRRGNLYVADSANCAIRMISPGGNVSTLAGTPGVYGEEDGPSKAARFNYPHGVAIDSHGRIYVADSGNNAVRRIQPARQRR